MIILTLYTAYYNVFIEEYEKRFSIAMGLIEFALEIILVSSIKAVA
jgi:hypothetical protein